VRIAFLDAAVVDAPPSLSARLAIDAEKLFAARVAVVDRAAMLVKSEARDACKADRTCLRAFSKSFGATHAWFGTARRVSGGFEFEAELVPVDGGASIGPRRERAPNVPGLSRAMADATGELVSLLTVRPDAPAPVLPVTTVASASAASSTPALPATPAPATPAEPRRKTGKPTLAVLELRDQGVGPTVTANLTDVVTATLGQLGVFDVLSRAEIDQMLAFETRKQLLGCDTGGECLAEIGGALGVANLVSGSIGKVGNTWFLSIHLTDTSTARIVTREHREIEGDATLVEQVRGAARFVVRDLLKGQEGWIVVRASESGADVELDGRLVGVTPLGRLQVNGGPHTLRVNRKGFIAWARDVDVVRNETTVVEVQLVPSPEFIAQYDGHAGAFRTWSFIAGGAGLLALAGGLAVVGVNRGRIPAYETSLAAANCGAGAAGAPKEACASFTATYDDIVRTDVLGQVVSIAGGALLGLGATLFFSGPPPGAYDEFKLANPNGG